MKFENSGSIFSPPEVLDRSKREPKIVTEFMFSEASLKNHYQEDRAISTPMQTRKSILGNSS